MSQRIAGYADFIQAQHTASPGHSDYPHYQEGEPFTDGRKVGWVKTQALLPYREYDRRGIDAHPGDDSARRIEAIKDDIKPGGKGWRDPISLSYDHKSHRALVDEGNHRLQAALEAGVEHVPVTVNRAYKHHVDSHRLALWGRTQVRTQPDDFGSVPGQMHPHEVLPDHLLHESSRRPDDFANWGPRQPRNQHQAGMFGPNWTETATDDKIDEHPAAEQIRASMTHHTGPQGHVYRLEHDSAKYVTATYLGKGNSRVKNPQMVGRLSYFGGKASDANNIDGRIHKVFVKPAHRRRGLASAMLDHARAMKRPGDDIEHSSALSEDGEAWSAKKASAQAFAPSENYYLATGGGKYHRINPITGQSLCRGTIACDRDSTPLIVSSDQSRVHPMVCRRCLPDDHPSRSGVTAKTAASHKLVHGDYEVGAVHVGDRGEAWAYHAPTGKRIGDMHWGNKHTAADCPTGAKWCDDDDHFTPNTIRGMGVHPDHRRQGVATAMLAAARGAGATVLHSSERSDAGDAWARSVGGDVPERTKTPHAWFWDPETMTHMASQEDGLPDGWTKEPGKEGSAIRSIYKHPDTGTSVYFPKAEQHHKHVSLSEDDEQAFIPHVHNAVRKTGEQGVTFMVDTGHDKYFRTAKPHQVGSTGAYVSSDDPDTVRVNPHWVSPTNASAVQNHVRKNTPLHFTPASHGVDLREYTVAHELGHVHDFRNQHTMTERYPGSGNPTKNRPSESGFYGRAGGKRMSDYSRTNTQEAYAEAFAHHHLAGTKWRGIGEHIDAATDKYAERYGWSHHHEEED